MKAPATRICLTMRSASDKDEVRDALARDWTAFMNYALPRSAWLPIPNIGREAVKMATTFAMDGLILTGGDDLGSDPLRDNTERALLEFALDAGLPVFGVCRGLQLVNVHLGGDVAGGFAVKHAGVRHRVRLFDSSAEFGLKTGETTVNSFHTQAVPLEALAQELSPLALSEDGLAEAVYLEGHPLACVQWHPERERTFQERDVNLIRSIMYGK